MRWVLAALLLLVAPASAASWDYSIQAGSGGAVLHVTATLQNPGTTRISVNDGAEPFVQHLQRKQGSTWVPVPVRGDSWYLPAATSCQIRYDYDLGEAADQIHDSDTASRHQGILQATPGCFVLRPVDGVQRRVQLRVSTPPDVHFVTGIEQAADGAYSLHASDLWGGPDCAFGSMSIAHLSMGGCDLQVAWPPHAFSLPDDAIAAWLKSKLQAVVTYFGRLPLQQGLILIVPGRGGVHGHAAGGSGFSVMVTVGTGITAEALKEDWTFTHEMVHVCTPAMPPAQHWMEEGIATYLEPIIRVRAGDLTVQKVWTDMLEGLPKGQPDTGDEGLNRTPTWGRTYWGGCMFWFLADLHIREQTHDQRSLRDALQALMAQGANIANEWEPSRVLDVGDAATGTHVLHDLYAELGDKPTTIDVSALCQQLGVKLENDQLTTFAAPLSALRDALTSP